MAYCFFVLLVLFLSGTECFKVSIARRRAMVLHSTEGADAQQKGFGSVKKDAVPVSETIDEGTKTYQIQAKRGVPEYNIFLRPANGTDTEWVPVGSMTIPRDTKVAKAVYEVEEELLKGTFKLYPKLRAFAEVRDKDAKGLFEYGYCLKAFPDEPITIIKKEDSVQQETNFFTNWLGKITNPNDYSDLKNKGGMTLKQ
jgi:hypothetical protein